MRRTAQGRPRTHRQLTGAPQQPADQVQPQQPQVKPRRGVRTSNFPLMTTKVRLDP